MIQHREKVTMGLYNLFLMQLHTALSVIYFCGLFAANEWAVIVNVIHSTLCCFLNLFS